MMYHTPVMLRQCIEALNISNGVYVDLTFGGGGHSKLMSESIQKGKLFCFDQDKEAFQNFNNLAHATFVPGNFRFFANYLRWHGVKKVDGILADLGVSMHQLDDQSRGFTYRVDTALDMRMNTASDFSAYHLINTYTDIQLKDIFTKYSDLVNAYQVAKTIVNARTKSEIKTTFQLADVLNKYYRPDTRNKFLSKVFQSIRIEVNHEMLALEQMLLNTLDTLKPGGRLVILTYHSVEDRMVKNFMKSGNMMGNVEKNVMGVPQDVPFKVLTPKPLIPDEEEIERNPASRSAKLRIAEKI